MSNKVTLYTMDCGGMYFPLFSIDIDKLMARGDTGHFMLRYTGQASALYEEDPSGNLVSIGHPAIPEHDTNSLTGGNPGRRVSNEIRTVTVLFATEHAKSLDDIDMVALDERLRGAHSDLHPLL